MDCVIFSFEPQLTQALTIDSDRSGDDGTYSAIIPAIFHDTAHRTTEQPGITYKQAETLRSRSSLGEGVQPREDSVPERTCMVLCTGIPINMRRNGLHGPYHPLQAVTWSLIFVETLCFYGLVLPFLGESSQQLWAGLYSSFLVLTVVSGVVTSAINPIDKGLRVVLQQRERGEGSKVAEVTVARGAGGEKVFCHICQTQVDVASAHCRFCNKCVDNFDHHCKWLNNCVGRPNYIPFLATIAGALGISVLQAALTIVALSSYYGHRHAFRQSEHGHMRWLPAEGHVALLVLSGLPLVFVVLLVGQLLIFHLMLLHEGLTTYEFLVREDRKHREREQAKSGGREMRRVGQGAGGKASSRVAVGDAGMATDAISSEYAGPEKDIGVP